MTTTAAPPSATAPGPKPVRRTPVWAKILLVVFIVAAIGAAAVAGLTIGKFLGAAESRDTQVIRSIKGEEQVILVTAGITDVQEERADGLKLAIGDFQLFTLPGTERSVLVRYEYDAKFGIEGKDVAIVPAGDNAYRITIPKFIYLGYANPDLSVAEEENGLLSWTTPEIDTTEVFEELLSEQAVDEHIDGFRPVLEEQAEQFYTKIVKAIDPTITVEFDFE
ncbi:hypothetical protein Q9S36_08335 [Microbacterium sp. ARD31]|uniref:hypothetical protein n=1 Tax=Microbacterium sp. ARD31 TaxID=2962576 RepID=UPI002880D26E|nr:hypothetical protein [Microbacterium sp. ARD31]MDT0180216.1 hypothetical protein [Microbacterium sp. ARD31]